VDADQRSESSKWHRPEAEVPAGTYTDLAPEYYDQERHPTCANFRQASAILLETWLGSIPENTGLIVEVGAGDSLVAELLVARSRRVELFLTDESRAMLSYSDKWVAYGAKLVVASATDLPLEDASASLVVACLGDPFNTPPYWSEAARVLRPGGIAFYTTPSFEWSRALRDGISNDWSLFELKDGRLIRVPSAIYPTQEQCAVIRASGLCVQFWAQVPLSALYGKPISPKLNVVKSESTPIVTGYFVLKP
jgi:SAM-dependent methyltransferase